MNARFVGALFVFAACGTGVHAGDLITASPGDQVVPNQYIVKTRIGVEAKSVPRLGALPNTQRVAPNLYVVNTDPTTAAAIAASSLVRFAEPNHLRHTTLQSANDPGAASQWALQTIHAAQAWGIIPDRFLAGSTPNQRVKIAVLDTGVDCTHPDFKNAGALSTDMAQGGQLSFALSQAPVATAVSNAACAWQDDYGHGTHVAGIIAAAANNSAGIVGAGYPVQLVIYKVMGANGVGDDATISAAIMSAADAGVQVISLSLGGFGYSQAMQSAIDYAWAHDALVIAAAGNGASSALFFPADANHALAVAASDRSNNPAFFSNYGPPIGIAAPGISIYSTAPTYPVAMGIRNYASLSGTSMATPHASAVAGLIAMTTPNLPGPVLMQRLQQSATSNAPGGGWDASLGYGVVNAFSAVAGQLRPGSFGSITGQVQDANNIPVSYATVSIGSQTVVASAAGLYRFANLVPGVYTLTVTAQGHATEALTAAVAAGADTVTLSQMDVSYSRITGNVSDGSGMAGAIVQALQYGTVVATAVADPSGNYALWIPNGGGTYDVRAAAIGHQTTTVGAIFVAPQGSAALDIVVPAYGRFTGVVTDSNGQPVANAQLYFAGAATTAGATTDATGHYTSIGLPAGTYAVSASVPGQSAVTVNATAAAGATELDLTLNQSPITVRIAPAAVTLRPAQGAQFTAGVAAPGASAPP